MNRPPPLRPGDSVAVVAPASPPRDLDGYRDGLDRLGTLYDIRTRWAPGQERGYLAAPDAERVAELETAIADDTIRALMCVRGGYGCLRLLDRLDWSLAQAHPTLLVGYSDITALHLALYARADWTGLSGPVVTEWPKLNEQMLGSYRTLVEGGMPALAPDALTPLRPGTATGPLLGGNLSVLSRLVGTPFAPNWTGALLVLEDVGEEPYRIDRMLGHLQHAGVLDAVSGVVLGSFGPEQPNSDTPTLSLATVLDDYFAHRPYPVVHNLPYGHLLPRCSLPIGARGQLSATTDTAQLTLQTPIVAP